MDPFLDVQDVDGKKADPWNSSSSLFTEHLASVTPKSSWVDSPAVLPPPPVPAKLSAVPPSLAPVTAVDPWQSSVESSTQRMPGLFNHLFTYCFSVAVEVFSRHQSVC